MPLYEYHCEACDERFEVIRSSRDTDLVKCPRCDRLARKLISAFAVAGDGPVRSEGGFSPARSACSWKGG